MPRFRVTEQMHTYATVVVEADNEQEARHLAEHIFSLDPNDEVEYETDYDSSKFHEIEELD